MNAAEWDCVTLGSVRRAASVVRMVGYALAVLITDYSELETPNFHVAS